MDSAPGGLQRYLVPTPPRYEYSPYAVVPEGVTASGASTLPYPREESDCMVPTTRYDTQDAQAPLLGACADATTLRQTGLPLAHMWHAESLDEPRDATSRRCSYATESGTPPVLQGGQLHMMGPLSASGVLKQREYEADNTYGGARHLTRLRSRNFALLR